ncbi:TetR/AcrR family transcriptional regulator [Rhodococcus sp. NPDC056960]|uniref:TetR/AcrR family transcriptional regulator n=1 Tax=Rhodococcus sp. NPDC056960 TaxID=3345982 RepID=UPI003639A41E
MASTTGQRSSRSGKPSTRGRRQDYIDAAARVFHRRGYDSATVGDIAEELDVTRAALYYYFNSKEELLYEIIREMHEINLGNLAIAEANAGDARTRLWNYFAGHARVNLKYFIQSSVAYRDLDHLGPDNRQDVVALRDKTQAFVRRLLSEAADEGVVCTLADLDLASIAMFTTVNAVHIWYHPDGPMDHDEAARSIADFVVAGVLCRGTGDVACPRHNPLPARNVSPIARDFALAGRGRPAWPGSFAPGES